MPMELNSIEMAINKLVGKTTVFVIIAWLVHMAIYKLVRTLIPNPIRKDDPSFVTSSSDESPPLAEKGDPAHQWNHEVFLSFRGVDTREGITSAIYDRLQNMRGIKTFMDSHNVEVGDSISPTLIAAIKESKFAIVVLSQYYADSSWCLEELTTIFRYMTDKNRILPLFYQVDPSDVRHQRGSFEKSFRKHEARHGKQKVKQWKDALEKVANLSGWDSNNYRSEKELVEDIVKFVWSKVLQVRIEKESTSREFEAFAATNIAMDKVMEGLQDDKFAVIGVYGMGGVGKTTLVKYVGAQARKNGLFNKVIVAVVSQSPNLIKIQAQLAEMLGLDLRKQETEEGRAFELKEKIMRANKLLIILDDIWRKVELSTIGIPNNEELQQCNCKIVLTTRLKNVCLQMDCHAMINLSILSEEDALKLFLKKARVAVDQSTESEIYKVANKVAKRCAGLPIALIAVARALGDADLDEWKEAAERLHASQPADPEDEKYVFNCIKLSYDYLRSTDAKSCLLLCCLFPEDHDIHIEDVFRYGMGKGLFQESNTMQEARAKVNLLVKSLKASSLLLESDEKGCLKMHDVVREVVMSISSSEDGQRMFVKSGQDLTEWPRINADINYSAISLIYTLIRKLPKDLVCSKLVQILSVKDSDIRELPETFFQSQNELRVLDIRGNKNIEIPPPLFNLLTNLRALFMYENSRFCVSNLGDLGKLEILSIQCFRGWFPKEVGQLSKLRMLDLSNYGSDSFPAQVISRLTGLEELYMKGNFIWGRKDKFDSRGNQTDLCCQEFIGLRNLNVLEVQIHDAGCLSKAVEFIPHWVQFDIIINENSYGHYLEYLAELPQRQKSLCLDTTIMNLPDWFLKAVTERAEKLVYYWFRVMNNILMEHGTGRLDGIKYLAVIRYSDDDDDDDCAEFRELMNAVTCKVPDKPLFENLEELHVEEVPCVELCVGELPMGSFCNLKKLKVLDCSNMENVLLSSNLLKRLQNLEELVCGDLGGIKYVFETDGMEPQQIICTKLRKIHLSNLPKLIGICNGLSPPHAIFQNLKYFAVVNCTALKYVFPSHSVVECLVKLEELYVYDCPNLKQVIGASEETIDMIEFPELKILFLGFLTKLRCFYGTKGSPRPIINCPKLEEISLTGCIGFSDALALSTFRSDKQVHVCETDEYWSTRDRLNEESRRRRTSHWVWTMFSNLLN